MFLSTMHLLMLMQSKSWPQIRCPRAFWASSYAPAGLAWCHPDGNTLKYLGAMPHRRGKLWSSWRRCHG